MSSIYERIGGEPAIRAAVELFYHKMSTDERVLGFFAGIDMVAQTAKQKAFLTMVTGGPNHYSGRDMRQAHRHLVARGLDDTHVDVVLEHLRATLRELGVEDALIDEICAVANSVRDDVLDR